jgi:hypothetical protein
MNPFCSHSPKASRGLLPLAAGAALLLAASQPLMAQLKWDTQSVDRAPAISDTKVEVAFGFENAGKSPVTIDALKSSCDCTLATLEKKTYAPGERGTISAMFKIGDRKGKQAISITVLSDQGTQIGDLRLNVAIPEVAKLMPTLVSWKTNAEPDAKNIEVQAAPGRTIRVVKATSKGNVRTSIETIEEGARYRVVISPEDTTKSFFSTLDIGVLVEGQEKTVQGYVRIGAGGVGMPASLIPGRSTSAEGADNLDVQPAVLTWDQGAEEAAPKFLTVRAPVGRTLKILTTFAGNPDFETSFEETKANEFRVSVKPRTLDKLRSTLVTIEAQSGEGKSMVRVPAQIKRPSPKP